MQSKIYRDRYNFIKWTTISFSRKTPFPIVSC